jgi:hypothetical protein
MGFGGEWRNGKIGGRNGRGLCRGAQVGDLGSWPGLKGEARRAALDRPLGRALLDRSAWKFGGSWRKHKVPRPAVAAPTRRSGTALCLGVCLRRLLCFGKAATPPWRIGKRMRFPAHAQGLRQGALPCAMTEAGARPGRARSARRGRDGRWPVALATGWGGAGGIA